MAQGIVRLEGNIREITKWFTDIQKKQIPYATSRAVNEVAFKAKNAEQRWMKRVFKNPVPFTLKGVLVEKSNKRDTPIHADVFLASKDEGGRKSFIEIGKGNSPAEYLEAQIEGGTRKHKKFEAALIHKIPFLTSQWYVVPSKEVRLNRFGNISPGLITKILSDVAALRGRPTIRGLEVPKRTKSQYWVIRPGGTTQPGIYKKKGKRGIVPVLIFIKGPPKYKKRFPFNKIAERVANREMNKAMTKWLRIAESTAK